MFVVVVLLGYYETSFKFLSLTPPNLTVLITSYSDAILSSGVSVGLAESFAYRAPGYVSDVSLREYQLSNCD